jgi:formylglycine-generating enzyme required for sulfatase activity
VLNLFFNQLTNLSLPDDVQNLTELNLDFNRFTSFSPPTNLTHLGALHLRANLLTNFDLPAELTALTFLDLSTNQLTNVTLPAGHPKLSTLALSRNKFTSFTLPPGLTNLAALTLGGNQLTNVVFPSDLGHLVLLDLGGNLLTSFTVPAGLTNLFGLFLTGNQLTNITLPPDLTQLGALGYLGNPLTTLVLPEFLAETTLAAELTVIRNLGVSVFTYPLTAQLVRPLMLIGAFKIGITGPPGVYSVLGSTNLATWSAVGVASNPLGSVNFHDVTANASPQKYYRALLQVPPENMVFIPPNTFTMGTPTNEVNRQADENPQTTVTITRGFWIGKYEVTQREYQAVVGSNPSQFPGDSNRPVETVSWLDATNYCALLTQRELAAGRISPGSRFRLPTEAEWECAARAGTSTRFSYGDDPNFTGLAANAWYAGNAGFGTHPVGQKAPNPWGLYDMEGNVLEWTLDWYGPYPGGSVTDPQGPASNAQGVKVIRGGAWDTFESDCRSGRRLTEGVSPFIHDFILGFRVVLVTET